MTNKERVIRTLTCQPTDHAPLVSWMCFSPWDETRQRWIKESGFDVKCGKSFGAWREALFGLETFFCVVPVDFGPLPHFEEKEISRDAEFVISRNTLGITTRNRLDGNSMPEWLDHPIKSPSDWERYKVERLQPQVEKRLAGLDQFIADAGKVDAPIQIGMVPWGMFGTVRDLLGVEELLVGFYTEPEMIRDMMQTFTSLWLEVYERIAERIKINHVHIWEDMSGKQGSLISPAMIEEFMMPQYDRVGAFVRAHGVEVFSVDSDGQVDELVPVMMRHGVNAFMPFEVQAGCDIEVFREKYPTLGIMGGLDKRALAAGKPQIHKELDRAERMIACGGWVPGFDHLIPPDVSWSNYKYFMDHLIKLVGVAI